MLSKKISKGIGSVIVVSVMIASALGMFPMLANGEDGDGDITPPQTILLANPANPLPWGWYAPNVTITLTATDSESGINKTYYRLNEAVWQTYSGPFVVDDPGTFDVEYYSIDYANNIEDSIIKVIKIPERENG